MIPFYMLGHGFIGYRDDGGDGGDSGGDSGGGDSGDSGDSSDSSDSSDSGWGGYSGDADSENSFDSGAMSDAVGYSTNDYGGDNSENNFDNGQMAQASGYDVSDYGSSSPAVDEGKTSYQSEADFQTAQEMGNWAGYNNQGALNTQQALNDAAVDGTTVESLQDQVSDFDQAALDALTQVGIENDNAVLSEGVPSEKGATWQSFFNVAQTAVKGAGLVGVVTANPVIGLASSIIGGILGIASGVMNFTGTANNTIGTNGSLSWQSADTSDGSGAHGSSDSSQSGTGTGVSGTTLVSVNTKPLVNYVKGETAIQTMERRYGADLNGDGTIAGAMTGNAFLNQVLIAVAVGAVIHFATKGK